MKKVTELIIIVKMIYKLQLIVIAASSSSNYSILRDQILLEEEYLMIGGDIILQPIEKISNKILMEFKNKEIEYGQKNPMKFAPARNFLNAKKDIEKSQVFKIIRILPKGAVLHVHSTAMVSQEYVYSNITFRDNLFICEVEGILKMHFFERPNNRCIWKLLSDLRNNNTMAQSINKRIKQQLTMTVDDPDQVDSNTDTAWSKFNQVFDTIGPLVRYKPVYKDYIYKGLQELYEDNVIYAEIRTTSTRIYELDGYVLNQFEGIGVIKQAVDEFLKDHQDFIGVKLIHAPSRKSSRLSIRKYLNNTKRLAIDYPNFVIGFDLVGQEDKGSNLHDFNNQLQMIDSNLKFFFHAGETNWYGTSIDENLIDAILLNTKRIGHGNAILKHPVVLNMLKQRGIAIEVLPISNQVLGLVKDLRNHPATALFAKGYPVVVSNDDPGVWGAKGLSFDFYEAFMGLMSQKADLRSLKQLSLNSFMYSHLEGEEKKRAYTIFYKNWDIAMKRISLTVNMNLCPFEQITIENCNFFS